MINVIFKKTDYEILEKQKECFDKYCQIINWGRKNPTKFIERFFELDLLDHQIYQILSTWPVEKSVWLCSRNSGKSYVASIYIMARSILIPNHNTYIMAPAGNQAQELFYKIESISKGNIASALNTNTVFLEELLKNTSSSNGFTHSKNSYSASLYNGSSINTLNSVAKNILGIRSNLSVYEEGANIEEDFYTYTLPFSAQDTNFLTGVGVNIDCYPLQLPNQVLEISSASSTDSHMFVDYKLCYQKMLCGDPNYFVCDLDSTFSLYPSKNGEPFKALVKKSVVDDAYRTNPFRAAREYGNKWDTSGGVDALVKRTTLEKYAQSYLPVFGGEKGKIYIIAYDPSSKLDNSVIGIAELWRDELKGWMGRMVNMINLIEVLKNGEKVLIQKPEQVERLKEILLFYNGKSNDYDSLYKVLIDAGSGGGGFDVGQYLMKDWEYKDKTLHRGLIDPEDEYMKVRLDDYPGAWNNLSMINFTKNKVKMYEATQDILNQGLFYFPKNLNVRGEMEFETEQENGEIKIDYVKVDHAELTSLIQMELAKEELVGMQKTKRQNNTIQFDTSSEKKNKGMHDDRADVVAMICFEIAKLRASDALDISHESKGFDALFNGYKNEKVGAIKNKLINGVNPFENLGKNPFFQ